ncbi:CoA protein activase [Fuchsiella alkaliacetigena]|uniref:CoA protein activase n=1 Tax=Fuchsiella alkaliacetigena TaxID=957042 RepID=UPI00200B0B24|nr:CoA protein activase [Fuchsiella alkaliacetigena]MCK8824613.1 CoA protein activase [Fuchsiella alkaliacetigena]
MSITFPQMGCLDIPLKSLFKDLKIDYLEPPPLSKRSLNLGVKHAPEASCLPFKLVLGNFIEALELGAEGILIAGGNGPCRFGHFGQLSQKILLDLGYDFETYIIEPSLRSIIGIIDTLAVDFSLLKLLKSLRIAWLKLNLIEDFNQLSLQLGAYLSSTDSLALKDNYLDLISSSSDKKELMRIQRTFRLKLKKLATKQPKGSLKIGLVGDIYTLLEPFANLSIAKRLNELGVEVDRAIYLSKWVKANLGVLGTINKQKIIKAAKGYLQAEVGGLGLETVGETVLYSRNSHYDGVIQLAPLGCMPEIVAKSALTQVENELNTPVLSLTLDEHSSAAGLQTRLEAFIDLLNRKSG